MKATKTTAKNKLSPRRLNSRSVLNRELAELEIGQTVVVPYKYCSVNNIRRSIFNAVHNLGRQFQAETSGDTFARITRTA